MSLDKRAARWTLSPFKRQNPIDLLKQVAKVINLISIQKIASMTGQKMNKKILVSYVIHRGKFSKSRHQRSTWATKDTHESEMVQIQARLSKLHGNDAKITITKIEDEKDIPNNPFRQSRVKKIE